jgi:hypothetical protein
LPVLWNWKELGRPPRTCRAVRSTDTLFLLYFNIFSVVFFLLLPVAVRFLLMPVFWAFFLADGRFDTLVA